MAELTFGENIN